MSVTINGGRQMPTTTVRVIALTLGLTGSAMAQERLLISSEWGKVTAELAENDATRALVRMLPITIEMRDHLRQEKTETFPRPAARRAANRLLAGHARALELGPFRDLLPRGPRPRARFADYAERFAGRDREADAVDRPHHALVG